MGKPNVADVNEDAEDFVDELKPGTELMHGQYKIESFLNAGGFGITYLAKDSLDRKIVIKECFPGAFCRRSRSIVQARSRAHQPELKSIVRLFVQEAKSLAKLSHPNIVGVHQVFEDNDTAYMALDFVEGRDMLDTMDDPSIVMTPDQISSMLVEILGAVGFIHDQDMLHRDISPDNILIDPDGRPVLIDFGAAREQATKQSRVLSALRVVKDGYSPQEFYIAGSEQNASSDLYALGASFYHFIKGDTPPNSQARLAAIASGEPDPFEPLEGTMPGFDDKFLAALDKSLAVLPKNRVQTAHEWLKMMEGEQPIVAVVEQIGAASADPVAEAVSAAAPAQESKSKMGLLLASAAVIAAVGVGAAMTLGGSDDAATETTASAGAEATDVVADTEVAEAPAAQNTQDGADAQAEAQQIAEAAAAAAAAAAEAQALAAAQEAEAAAAEAERIALAEAEAAAAEAERIALAEAEAAAEEARAARAAEFARIAAETALRREEQALARAQAEAIANAEAMAAAQAQAQADAEAQAAAEARALAEAQAAEEARDAAEAEARRIAEAEAAKAEAEAAEAARIAAAAAAEAQARAEAAALAAATLDTPTPPSEIEGISGLTTVAGAPQNPLAAFTQALPSDIALGEILADTRIAGGVTTDVADTFAVANLPLTSAIPAFVPGNEIIEEAPLVSSAESSYILSAWSVDLPFAGSSSSSRVIGEVGPVAPLWVDTGVEIDSVNGSPIDSIGAISEVLRNNIELSDEELLAIDFGVKDQSGGVVEQRWSVPIVQQTAFLNGIGFETRMIDGVWTTKVTSAPADVAGDLQVGDELIAYMRTSEKIDARTSLKTIMDREISEGTSQFSFAVNRDGNMWIAALDYAENN